MPSPASHEAGLPSITAQNLTKVYKLYSKPLDRLKEVVFRGTWHQPFASLSDISFRVYEGECLGVIGENGAGKSTLLKILAGTLSPTSGKIQVRGRVAALLELGAGFHPEFTGRQNIALNASLLGLSEAEIENKEPAIVDFAELGRFIDRPLKTYSSGMVVRLAFSIATSVDPDILVIDEALSVGDQYFQKKCIDRMLDFRKSGQTIVFCSHSMYTVNLLCNRALWLENGMIRNSGVTTEITADYENFLRRKEDSGHEVEYQGQRESYSVSPIYVQSIKLNGGCDNLKIEYKSDLEVEIDFISKSEKEYALAIGIRRNDGLVCHAVNLSKEKKLFFSGKGNKKFKVVYHSLPFLHGEFSIVAFLLDEHGLHCYDKKESQPFTITPPQEFTHELGLLDLHYECDLL